MKKHYSFSWFHIAYGIVTVLLFAFLVIPILQLFFGSFRLIFTGTKPLPAGFFSYLIHVTGNTLTMAFLTTAFAVLIALTPGVPHCQAADSRSSALFRSVIDSSDYSGIYIQFCDDHTAW